MQQVILFILAILPIALICRYIYTKDRKKFDIVVKKLKTGMIAWNNLYYLRPCNPFGGYKKSGIGRNNSEFGLKELCNIKVVTYEK